MSDGLHEPEKPTLTDEQLDELLEGWMDKIEQFKQKQLDKKIANDPYMKYLNRKLAKLSYLGKKNRDRIIKGRESDYKKYMRTYDYSD